jgi:hypothetical protein
MTEYDDYFEKIFKTFARGREEHEFVHFNNAMGIQIHGKEHYKMEMKKRRMVPYEEAEKLADNWDKKNAQKEYGDLSTGATEIIQSLKLTADSKGNIVLGGRAIKALQEIGAIGRAEVAQEVSSGMW